MDTGGRRHRHRWRWWLLVMGMVCVLVLGGTVAWASRSPSDAHRATTPAPRTAPVVRRDLTTSVSFTGTVRYPQAQDVDVRAAGVITSLPPTGASLETGDVAARVNDKPVVVLSGALPMWRDLQVGVVGRDVEQLERNLTSLSPGDFAVDDEFTPATAAAVKRWQHALGVRETGQVSVGDVVVLPAARRVESLLVEPGATAPVAALRVSAPDAVVVADVPTATAGWAKANTSVDLRVGSTRATGLVASVGPVTASDGGNGDGTDAAGSNTPMSRIVISTSAPISVPAGTSVSIVRALQTRKQVLAVPVTALVAVAGGGYGVELITGDGERLVAVQVGLIAEGEAEVSAGKLRPGTEVVIAS